MGIANQIPISPINKGNIKRGINTNIIDLPQEIKADSKGFSMDVWKLLDIMLMNDNRYANVKKNIALLVKSANSLFPLEKRYIILSPNRCILMKVVIPIIAPDFKATLSTSLILSIRLAPKLYEIMGCKAWESPYKDILTIELI